ncbi:hypothetical protein FBALC1_13552 [Flavobacteriales bacterium ALC-1]|nr:hypothetical protein FBALC1_13552 [Flavobacteriales bacterium ALC-1]
MSIDDENNEVPKHKKVIFTVDISKPENYEPDFELENENEFENLDSTYTCDKNNLKKCIYLYVLNSVNSSIWKIRANRNLSTKIGVTYGQKIGRFGETSTEVITLFPGEIKDLGYRQFGAGTEYRYVWIISVWEE